MAQNRHKFEDINFVVGMFVCTGVYAALPELKEIRNILLNGNEIFLMKNYEIWYIEHLRSYQLTDNENKGHTLKSVCQIIDHCLPTKFQAN